MDSLEWLAVLDLKVQTVNQDHREHLGQQDLPDRPASLERPVMPDLQDLVARMDLPEYKALQGPVEILAALEGLDLMARLVRREYPVSPESMDYQERPEVRARLVNQEFPVVPELRVNPEHLA